MKRMATVRGDEWMRKSHFFSSSPPLPCCPREMILFQGKWSKPGPLDEVLCGQEASMDLSLFAAEGKGKPFEECKQFS